MSVGQKHLPRKKLDEAENDSRNMVDYQISDESHNESIILQYLPQNNDSK